MIRLHNFGKISHGFTDMEGVLDLTLNAIKEYPQQNTLQAIAFKVLFLIITPPLLPQATKDIHVKIMRSVTQSVLFDAKVSPVVAYMSKMCFVCCRQAFQKCCSNQHLEESQSGYSDKEVLEAIFQKCLDASLELNTSMTLHFLTILDETVSSKMKLHISLFRAIKNINIF